MSQWSPDRGDVTPPVPRLRDRELTDISPPPRAPAHTLEVRQRRGRWESREVPYQPRQPQQPRTLGPLWVQALAAWGLIALVILTVVIYERLT